MIERAALFPPLDPDQSGHLEADGLHRVWWEASGSPDGVPVIYLHGGPGNPPTADHRRLFDPDFYRLIVMHQRGCGRSTPHCCTNFNTTPHLIADIERLRRHLSIERWLVAGGSWGSCLSLAYGEAHPERCIGFRLRGVFLGGADELDWYWNGTRNVFPDAFSKLVDKLLPIERADPRQAYDRLIQNDNPAVREAAGLAFARYSSETTRLAISSQAAVPDVGIEQAAALATLFFHYSRHAFFLEPGQILRGLGRIRHLPCVIVNGRYDVSTPAATAWGLHRLWPGSELTIVANGAHAELDAGLAAALLASHERLKTLV